MKHICSVKYTYGRRSYVHDIYYDEIAKIYYCEGIPGSVKVFYTTKTDYTRYTFTSDTRRAWSTTKGRPNIEEVARIFRSKCPDFLDILN